MTAGRGYAAIGLWQPKNSLNVGSVLRNAACFGTELVVVSGKRISPRACTDTLKTWRHTPLIQTEDMLKVIPYSCVPVAVELTDNATNLGAFVHPERAMYIFGPEDGSIPSEVVRQCAHVVQIPTAHCMNLAATTAVVLYDRLNKRGEQLR